jgi:nucleoside-triphosphatase THEP1
LNAQQAAAVLALTAPDAKGIHVLSGAPGSGKTFCTKVICEHLAQQGRLMFLSATTGAAATRLSRHASTVHSAFKIPAVGRYVSELSTIDMPFQKLLLADVIIIDEMSMLTSLVFSTVLHRIREVAGHDFLASKLILLVGDHCQLPPVCRHRQDDGETCATCHLSACHEWEGFTWHHLLHSVRQAEDPDFIDFLGNIRKSQPTQGLVDAALASRVVPPEKFQECLHDVDTVLCTHNEDVDFYNDCLLRAKFPEQLIDCGPVKKNFNEDSLEFPDVQKFHAGLKNTRLGLAAVGAPIIYKANIDVKQGAVNGASGRITGFKITGGVVITIHTTVDATRASISLNRTWFERCYRDNVCYSVKAFPCMLGFAMTGHASQGATITGKTLICIRNSFCRGLVYVMLSRVTCRANIFLRDHPSAADFRPAQPPKVLLPLLHPACLTHPFSLPH